MKLRIRFLEIIQQMNQESSYTTIKNLKENNSWGIKSLDVIRIGQLFTTGTYPTEKIIVIAGSEVTHPCHIKTREGICFKRFK